MNSNNNNQLNYKLFQKVWGNIVLRNEILFHLRLFNIHLKTIHFSIENLKQYKYKGYLNSISIGEFSNPDTPLVISSDALPLCITEFIINSTNVKLSTNCIPDSVTSVELNGDFNQPLVGLLPNGLKSLVLGEDFKQDLKVGDLPLNSLTNLTFLNPLNYIGGIEAGSISETLLNNGLKKQFHFKYNSNLNKHKILDYPIPMSTIHLEFDPSFNQVLQVGDIPSNVRYITFGSEFNQIILENVLPLGLKEIKFGNSYNQVLDNGVLPKGISSIIFGSEFNQVVSSENIPCDSIETISFGYQFVQPVQQLQMPNLKSLQFHEQWDHIIPVGWLPNTLTSLDLGGYNRPITDILPSSLKYLDLGYEFNQILSVGDLPSSIESLSIGYSFTRSIEPNVLPSSLKKLIYITTSNIDLSTVNCLPPSLQNIYIYSEDSVPLLKESTLPSSFKFINCTQYRTNLIEHYDFDFIFKYFKYNSDNH